MAKGKKLAKRKRNILSRALEYFELLEKEPEDQAELSRSARDHLHETVGEANLPTYKARFQARVEGDQAHYQGQNSYQPEGEFHYDAEQLDLPPHFNIQGFTDPGAHNIAEYFLAGYAGQAKHINRGDTNPRDTLEDPYCAAQSPRAKEMRAELNAKIAAFEASLQQGIQEGVSQETLAAAKLGFMSQVDDFLSDCEAEIKNRGPVFPGKAPDESSYGVSAIDVLLPPVGFYHLGQAISKARYYQLREQEYKKDRYLFGDFRDALSSHLDHKLENTRILNNNFQLWNPAQLTFNGKNDRLTDDEIHYKNQISALKRQHDTALFSLLNSLDNDPHQVLRIKGLEKATKQKLNACLAEATSNGVEVGIHHPGTVFRAAIVDADGTVTQPAIPASLATNEPLSQYLETRLPTLTQQAVDLRADMNKAYVTPKSRLQQWRWEYDRDQAAAHNTALDAPHRIFTAAAKTAQEAITALTPSPIDGDAYRAAIGNGVAAPHPHVPQIDELTAGYQTLDTRLGAVVPKPAHLSADPAPTAAERNAHTVLMTAYDNYVRDVLPLRSVEFDRLALEGADLRSAIQSKLYEPVAPVVIRRATAEEQAAHRLATAAYTEAEPLYREYRQVLQNLRDLVLPVFADPLNPTDPEKAELKTYQEQLSTYQQRQAELETELARLKTPIAPPAAVDAAYPTADEIVAKERYDQALAAHTTAQQAAKLELEQLTKSQAFYCPDDPHSPEGRSFADFSQEYRRLSLELVTLQADYKDAARKLLDIEYRWSPAQAKVDLDALKAKYEALVTAKTAELTQLNTKAANFKTSSTDSAIQAEIQKCQTAFNAQITALTTAQKTAFDATHAAASTQRDTADKACQLYQLQYRVYCLQNGPIAGPLTPEQKAEILAIKPAELLDDERLSTKALLGHKLDLGLVSIRAMKVGGNTAYRIDLTEPSMLGADKNHYSDGSIKLSAYCSHMCSKKSRTAEIRAALGNPEKLDDVGLAVRLIMTKIEPKITSYKSIFPVYNEDNLNTMMATSMACIAQGIDFDPAADFDRSFRGTTYTHDHAEHVIGVLEGAERKKVRAAYLRKIASYQENFKATQAFNNVCREAIAGRLLPPGTPAFDMNNPEVQTLKHPHQLFIYAVAEFSRHDTTTAAKLTVAPDPAAKFDVIRDSIHQLKRIDLTRVTGLGPDGGGNHGRSAALFGVVLDRNSASEILALKERELCCIYRELREQYQQAPLSAQKKAALDQSWQEANNLRRQLNLDYIHISQLANNQGLDAPAFKVQQLAAMARVNAAEQGVPPPGHVLDIQPVEHQSYASKVGSYLFGETVPSYGEEMPSTERINDVDTLRTLGHIALQKIPPFSGTVRDSSGDSSVDLRSLVDLAKIHTAIIHGREVGGGQADTALDTKFSKDALAAIEDFANDHELENKRGAAIAELNGELAAATQEPQRQLIDSKIAAVNAIAAKLRTAQPLIQATRAEIYSNTNQYDRHRVPATTINDAAAKIRGLQAVDNALNALYPTVILPTQQQDIQDLGSAVRQARATHITWLNEAITNSLNAMHTYGIPNQIVALTEAIGALSAIQEDRLQRSTPGQQSVITDRIGQLERTKDLIEELKSDLDEAEALEVPDAAESADNSTFLQRATFSVNKLNAQERTINDSALLSPAHKAALRDEIAAQRVALIAKVTTVSEHYQTQLPNAAVLIIADDFNKAIGQRGLITTNPGLDTNLDLARKQLAATQAIITTAAPYQQLLADPTTYKEAEQRRQKLIVSLRALYAIEDYEALRSPEQLLEITDLIPVLEAKLRYVVNWIREEVAVYRNRLAAIIDTGNAAVAVDSIDFYTAITDEMIKLNQFITAVNDSTTISPAEKANLNEKIQGRKEVLIGRAFDQSATYATTLPNVAELTAAKAFVTAAGLPDTFISRHDMARNIHVAEGTARITTTQLQAATRLIGAITNTLQTFTQLGAQIEALKDQKDKLEALNTAATASPQQRDQIALAQPDLEHKIADIIEIAQQKASRILNNSPIPPADLPQVRAFFVDYARGTMKLPHEVRASSVAVQALRATIEAGPVAEKTIVDACDDALTAQSSATIHPDENRALLSRT